MQQTNKDHSPFFSVIIPTYNRAHLLPQAIESVLNQTYRDFELIVVDDGSSDNTSSIVHSFSDKRIKYIYQHNSGRSEARNTGVSRSRGKYICFLDDDDLFVNNSLDTYRKTFEEKGGDRILIGQYQIIQNNKTIRESSIKTVTSNRIRFIWIHPLYIQSMAFPRKIFDKERFPKGIEMWEDKHFLLRAAKQMEITVLDEVTAIIVDHPQRTVNQVDRKNFKKQSMQMIESIENLLVNYEDTLKGQISNQEIQKLKSESLIGKSLDALSVSMKANSYWALKKAATKYFHPLLLGTYVNTLRKILLS